MRPLYGKSLMADLILFRKTEHGTWVRFQIPASWPTVVSDWLVCDGIDTESMPGYAVLFPAGAPQESEPSTRFECQAEKYPVRLRPSEIDACRRWLANGMGIAVASDGTKAIVRATSLPTAIGRPTK